MHRHLETRTQRLHMHVTQTQTPSAPYFHGLLNQAQTNTRTIISNLLNDGPNARRRLE